MSWRVFQISAWESPNVEQGEEVYPGLISQEGIDRLAEMFGRGTPIFRARVDGQFPEESEAGLIRRSWLDAAAERWEKTNGADGELVVGCDPARFGPDSTCLAVRRGDRLERLVTWGREGTMDSVERIRKELTELGIRPRDKVGERYLRRMGSSHKIPTPATVVIDEIGVGAGVLDRLKELEYEVAGFKGSRSPKDEDRFRNLRAESYWHLRDRLETGTAALPPDEALFEELLAIEWSPTTEGKVQIEGKSDIRSRLGRSPDRADAVAMAFWPRAKSPPPKGLTLHYD